MKKKFGFILAISLILVVSFGVYYQIHKSQNTDIREFHLAVAGPMDKLTDAGNTFYRSAKLIVDQFNQQSETHGYRIVLQKYNDSNDPDKASKVANQISEHTNNLGVIGHNYSSISAIAGQIYKSVGLPAISPTATNINVTKDNDWYFRTVFTDNDQGHFLANYAKVILKQGRVVIVNEELSYGKNLAEVFEQSASKIGMKVVGKYSFDPSSNALDTNLEKLVHDISTTENDTLIFIASHYQEGAKLIRMLKDNNSQNMILTPDAFAQNKFADFFSDLPKEIGKPGYYSDNVYVAMPIHYDVANFQAQQFYKKYQDVYKVAPDWRAAFAYDAAMLLVNAIEKSNIKEIAQFSDQRKAIKDYLQGINRSDRAVLGITGINYFNEHGDPQKPIIVGKFKDKEIIPALTQLKPVPDIESIPNLDEAIKEEWIIKLADNYMYKTNIVFTGVKINSVKDIDMEELLYTMDLDIWFRYGGTVDVRDIKFLNQDKSIQLRSPVEELQFGNQVYRRYKVNGRFKADFLFPSGPRKHILGTTFSHNSIPRHNLIFIPDKIGGASTWMRSLEDSKNSLEPDSNWMIHQLWSFQDIDQRDILGNIKFINNPNKKENYSQFTTSMEIKDKAFDLRNSLVTYQMALYLLIISAILGFLFDNRFQVLNRFYFWVINQFKKDQDSHTNQTERKSGYSYYIPEPKLNSDGDDERKPLVSRHFAWWLTSICLLMVLFSVEIIVVQTAYAKVETGILSKIIELFHILWWVVPTHIISSAINEFFWRFIETNTRHKIPRFLRGLVSFTLYLFMSFGVMAFVYNQKVTSILGTSGIFVMIIGLAVQMNISNIFAGLVLNMERSINIGDWIKIGDGEEGKVLEINWRTTKIQTRKDIILHIPNNTISEAEIQNFTTPHNLVCMWFFIDIEKTVPFDKVRDTILKAISNVELVLKDPAPSVKFNQFTHFSAKYTIVYNIDDYGKKNVIKGQIWEQILFHLKEERIYSANITMNLDNLMLNDG